jgi:hypothetical protein
MAEYLLQDKDKAAFINRMNKVLSQIGSGFGLDQSSFVDVPETEDDDKCIFIASTDVEEKVLDSLIDKNAFTYKVKKISVNEILREIKEYPIDSNIYAARILNKFHLATPLDVPTILRKLESLKNSVGNLYSKQKNRNELVYIELENFKEVLNTGDSIVTAIDNTIDNLVNIGKINKQTKK